MCYGANCGREGALGTCSNPLHCIPVSYTHLDFIRKAIMDIQAHASELSEVSQKQIESIERSLEEELRKSLESFAGAMVALSNKFASDYTPLTDRLREVVGIAERMSNATLN